MVRKTRILLTLPIWDLQREWGKLSGLTNNRFHYGLASMAAFLKKYDFSVSFVDPQFFNNTYKDFESYLISNNFHIVGITSWTSTILSAFKTVRFIKQVLPNTVVVIGGIHVSNFPQRTLQECNEIDYVIVGEGEKSFLKFCEYIDGVNVALEEIPGLVYRRNGLIIENLRDEYLPPHEFPIPAYDEFPIEKYQCQPPLYKNLPTYLIMAGRGCPYDCAFCDVHTIHGKKVRQKEIETLINEIKLLQSKYKARGIWFQDSTFTLSKQWVSQFCERLIQEKINIPWGCFTRVDRVDFELLKLMKEAGCWQIGYGLESANQKTLNKMNKRTTVKQNTDIVRITRQVGIKVYASYILGWPGENYDAAWRTVKFARNLATHNAIFNLPLPFPKTELYSQCKEDGGLRLKNEHDWEAYEDVGSSTMARLIYVNPNLGKDRSLSLIRKAYKSYYSSPKVLMKHLSQINSKDQFILLFKKALTFLRI